MVRGIENLAIAARTPEPQPEEGVVDETTTLWYAWQSRKAAAYLAELAARGAAYRAEILADEAEAAAADAAEAEEAYRSARRAERLAEREAKRS